MAQNPGRGSSAALGRAVGDADRGTGLAAGDCSLRGARADPRMSDKSSENRSEEHTSELQSLMRISYAVFCLKNKRTVNEVADSMATLLYRMLQMLYMTFLLMRYDETSDTRSSI